MMSTLTKALVCSKEEKNEKEEKKCTKNHLKLTYNPLEEEKNVHMYLGML